MVNLRREMDRLFDDFGAGFALQPFRWPSTAVSLPIDVDVVEQADRFVISADLPGLDQKDLEINVSGDVLSISGQKNEEREETQKNYYLNERRFGSFQRSFTLPGSVDREAISADFANGVLKVTLPKTTEAKNDERKIDIKPG
jgi:HSP20 family protein